MLCPFASFAPLRERNFELFVQCNKAVMQFLSLQPFIPSGKNLDLSRKLFQALGFNISWDAGDYVGFERDGCGFILQHFDDKSFAENLMINVRVSDVNEFRRSIFKPISSGKSKIPHQVPGWAIGDGNAQVFRNKILRTRFEVVNNGISGVFSGNRINAQQLITKIPVGTGLYQ